MPTVNYLSISFPQGSNGRQSSRYLCRTAITTNAKLSSMDEIIGSAGEVVPVSTQK